MTLLLGGQLVSQQLGEKVAIGDLAFGGILQKLKNRRPTHRKREKSSPKSGHVRVRNRDHAKTKVRALYKFPTRFKR